MTTPRGALEQVWAAAGGDPAALEWVSLTGDDPMLPTDVRIGTAAAAVIAATGLAASEIWRLRTGRAQSVAVDMRAAIAAFRSERYLRVNGGPAPDGRSPLFGFYPTGVFETKDGHINIAASGDDLYDRFCRAIARPDLRTDPRFATASARSANRDVLMEVFMPITRQKPSAAWITILNDAGVPCGPIYRIDEAFADPQVQHLKMAQPVHSPELGDLTILGHPVSHGERRQPIRTPAPELGQDNEEILTAIGYSKDQIADLAKRGVV